MIQGSDITAWRRKLRFMRRRGTLVLALLLLTCVLVSCGGSNSSPPQLNPLPALSSISPAFAAAGDSAFSLAVNGTNFMPTSVVQWNSANHPTTYVSSTQLTASISAADIASGGAASITVSNPAPGGGTSSAVTFTTFAVTA